ncbi:MAG: hypothetical protein ABIR70_13545 [Bryobacteraceae bacterium]
MAEFRKLFYALGLAALLAGVSTTAKAQGISCSVGTGSVPTVIRAESFADLVGDFVLDCVGGTPTTVNNIVPAVNIAITLSTNITSKILDNSSGVVSAGGNFTEALLIIDEPNVGTRGNRSLLACGSPTAPYNPNSIGTCQISAPASPDLTYSGTTGFGTFTCDGVDPDGTGPQPARPTASQFGCGRPNVFQGRQGLAQNSGNTNIMLFNGVPFDPPGATAVDNPLTGHRILRITNIRANSPQVAGGFLLAAVTASVNISGIANLTIAQPTQTVANVAIGLQSPVVSGLLTFVQCTSQSLTSTLRFREGFPASFKPKGLEQIVANGIPGNALRYLSPNASYGAGILNQNVPGVNYFSESGFVSVGANDASITATNPAPNNPPLAIGSPVSSTGNGGLTNTTNIALAGIATQGTRIAVTFSNVPAGMTLSVLNTVPLYQSGSTTLRTGVAVRTSVVSARGDGPFTSLGAGSSVIVNNDMVVYEVLFADGITNEDMVIDVTITNPATALASDLPEVNKTAQVAGGFAPFILASDDPNVWGRAQYNPANNASVSSGPTILPVPRFRTQSAPVDMFRVNKCACNLLFPFITNAAAPDRNFDTGIALANTSLTPGAASTASQRFGFSNTSQSGPVQFWFYPVNATDPPVATKCTNTVSPDTCPSPTTGPSALSAGETLLYVLSSGSTRWGLKGAPGFTGYMIAQASFQYCHAFAYISPQGATPLTNGMSVGYLALQLDNNVNRINGLSSRTGLLSESLAH